MRLCKCSLLSFLRDRLLFRTMTSLIPLFSSHRPRVGDEDQEVCVRPAELSFVHMPVLQLHLCADCCYSDNTVINNNASFNIACLGKGFNWQLSRKPDKKGKMAVKQGGELRWRKLRYKQRGLEYSLAFFCTWFTFLRQCLQFVG